MLFVVCVVCGKLIIMTYDILYGTQIENPTAFSKYTFYGGTMQNKVCLNDMFYDIMFPTNFFQKRIMMLSQESKVFISIYIAPFCIEYTKKSIKWIIQRKKIKLNPKKHKEVLMYIFNSLAHDKNALALCPPVTQHEKSENYPSAPMKFFVSYAQLILIAYFIEFQYYKTYSKPLTGCEFKKQLQASTHTDILLVTSQHIIDAREALAAHFINESPSFNFDPRELVLLRQRGDLPNLETLSAQDKKFINTILAKLPRGIEKLHELIYQDIPWQTTKNGEVIDYKKALEIPDKALEIPDDE